MEISVNSSYIRSNLGKSGVEADIEAALICKEAGFTVLDFTPSFLGDEDYEKKLCQVAEVFAREGIRVEQDHGPMNRYARRPREEFQEQLRRSFQAAKILGLRYHVIHADEYPTTLPYDSKEACDYSYELYAPYVEYAEKNGFGVAIENVFDEPNWLPAVNGRNRYTATVEEQIEIIDRFGTPAVTACWDFGHGNVSFGAEGPEKLKLLGKRLSCTHVHDNKGKDDHMPLYFGNIDWKTYAEYLKKEYSGVFTYEFVYHTFPKGLLVDYLKLAKKTAEALLL